MRIAIEKTRGTNGWATVITAGRSFVFGAVSAAGENRIASTTPSRESVCDRGSRSFPDLEFGPHRQVIRYLQRVVAW